MAKQKKKQDGLAIFYENTARAKQLTSSYYEVYDKLTRYITKEYADVVKSNIIISHILDDLFTAQDQKRDISTVVSKNFNDYVRKIEKGIDFKADTASRKQLDYDKFIIAGMWYTMCSYIVLLYVKELLTDNYLIHASVDVLVAIVAFYIMLNNLNNQRSILRRHALTMKSLFMQLSGLIVGCVVTIISLRSPFDFSFVILVFAYIFAKKMFKREMEAL